MIARTKIIGVVIPLLFALALSYAAHLHCVVDHHGHAECESHPACENELVCQAEAAFRIVETPILEAAVMLARASSVPCVFDDGLPIDPPPAFTSSAPGESRRILRI